MKKLLARILAAIMILSLVACKPLSDDGTTNPNHNSNEDVSNEMLDKDENFNEGSNDKDWDNNNNLEDIPLCSTHTYADNVCLVCGCSLWSGEVDTSWYSVIDLEFTISTAEQFAGLIDIVNNGSDLSGVKITLANHIDMNGKAISPIGATPENRFSGEFDGSGYSICNIVIDANSIVLSEVETPIRTYYTAYVGLFGYVDGNIFNLNVKQLLVNISSETVNSLCIGGVAAYNQGDIKNCSTQGKIEMKLGGIVEELYAGGISSKAYGSIAKCSSEISIIADINNEERLECNLAGIVGYAKENSISQCCSKGSISLTTNLFANLHMGGLIGLSNMANIADCYSNINVSALVMGGHGAAYYAGGLLGKMERGAIKSCYSTGNVSLDCPENGYAGALIGCIEGTKSTTSVNDCFAVGNVYCKTETDDGFSATIGNRSGEVITNCYYLDNQVITGDETVIDGTPAGQNDLTDIAFYTNRMPWDSEIWNLKDGEYPTLK